MGGSGGGLPLDGIAEPSFGVEETVKNIYGSNDYFTHYVDNTNPSATDDGNPYGTPEQPRLTMGLSVSEAMLTPSMLATTS